MQQCIKANEKTPKPRKRAWIAAKLTRLVRKQHQLHQQRLNSPTQENIQKHANFRNKLAKLIKTEKKNHIISKIEKFKNDPKRQVQVLREILPQKKTPKSPPPNSSAKATP